MFQNLNFNSQVNANGMGLGLTLCKRICNILKGTITCESKINVGTKFTFCFPY